MSTNLFQKFEKDQDFDVLFFLAHIYIKDVASLEGLHNSYQTRYSLISCKTDRVLDISLFAKFD